MINSQKNSNKSDWPVSLRSKIEYIQQKYSLLLKHERPITRLILSKSQTHIVSGAEYADKVIQVTGIAKFVPKHRRFYRDSCEYINGNYMKRITRIEPDLRNVLILDNRPEVVLNKKNVLTIRSWEDGEDNELILCVKNLKKIYESFDVRNISY